LREYKEKQSEILEQMQGHSTADEQFYLTANMTLNIAKRAKEIFMSSEVDEKRQFLGFLLQNCMLDEKKLDFTMRSPFNLLLNNPDSLTMRRIVDYVRTYWMGKESYFYIPKLSVETAEIIQ
jgi:hypothetical protein